MGNEHAIITRSGILEFTQTVDDKEIKSKSYVLFKSVSSFQILLPSGDIAQNPGPNKRASEKTSTGSKQMTTGSSHRLRGNLKCDKCEKTIRKNQNKVMCEACFGQQHLKCTELNAKYVGTAWICPKCLISVLPFAST